MRLTKGGVSTTKDTKSTKEIAVFVILVTFVVLRGRQPELPRGFPFKVHTEIAEIIEKMHRGFTRCPRWTRW
jgi:hypothetical protein